LSPLDRLHSARVSQRAIQRRPFTVRDSLAHVHATRRLESAVDNALREAGYDTSYLDEPATPARRTP
jgi:hypothetical protein